ncbi:MAG: chromate transporter [Oscillospiraceae bacterium]|jgi:chromate transporter|nr:chromate transporter [Oscillospiraceae bacterium]
MNIHLDLFVTFCKIGGLTFGGGYAMLPMLQREVVESRKWATESEIMDYYAVGQCLPGLIAVNTAIFTGNKVKGPMGGICAALGVVFPSLVVITVIAAFLNNFAELAIVQSAFAGIRVCVLVLIANAIIKLRKGSLVDWYTCVLFAAVFLLSILTDVSPILYVVASALAGVFIQWRTARGGAAS